MVILESWLRATFKSILLENYFQFYNVYSGDPWDKKRFQKEMFVVSRSWVETLKTTNGHKKFIGKESIIRETDQSEYSRSHGP